jgi:small GTP-binding protein
MERTPKGLRLHIGLFGRRNVGKSSLLNAITRQQVSIVSDVAGTTTDPVEKPMELLPLGPVLFIDTAGIDDEGALGEMRVARTRKVFDRTDLGVVIAEPHEWGFFEQQILDELRGRKCPIIVVFNKIDLGEPDAALVERLKKEKVRIVRTVCSAAFRPYPGSAAVPAAAEGQRDAGATGRAEARTTNSGILDFRQALLDAAPADFLNNPAILADLVGPGEMAVLVVPVDKEAPKGRLIVPQVQAIRDLIDGDAFALVVKERELREALDRLKRPPRLVVTDSQAFLKVVADTPREIPLTSFSILFARYKGDLVEMVRGTLACETLRPGDRILVAEACSHHPIAEDIGRVKIPRWLTQLVGGKLEFTTMQGHDFPEDLSSYKLVIHCGACMMNRREMLTRILRCKQAGVPITNYGLVVAYSLGIFERALEPFPAALDIYREAIATKA